MRGVLALILLGWSFMTVGADAPSAIPLKDFWRHSEYEQLRISPDGKHMAAIVPDEQTRALVVFDTDDRHIVGVARFSDKHQVDTFTWVNDQRLAFTISSREGRLVSPQARGELLFMRIDGKEKTGYAGGRRASLLTRTLRDGSDDLIVTDYVFGRNSEKLETMLYRVNAKTAKGQRLATAPVPNAGFLVTSDGAARVAVGGVGFQRSEVHYLDPEDGTWRMIHSEQATGVSMSPLAMHGDGSRFYAVLPADTGPHALYLIDPQGKREEVARDALTDPSDLLLSLDGREVIAVEFSAGVPRRQFLLPEHPDALLLQRLQRSFKGQWVSLANATRDGARVVFIVHSDRNSGEYYLYERATGKAAYIASTREWMDPELMSEMKPIKYTARDGRSIHGWLTLPRGVKGRNLPLIVHPHGGPHDTYDEWGYNPEVQLFASRGYAVLQPNFRGSGGFGSEFESAGYLQWGASMQDDVTDATRWAIDEGIADPDRICTYGASYGAYAAVMAVVREPDMYRCAIGFVGVYDLRTMYKRGEIRERASGVSYLETVLGTDDSDLDARSPARQTDKIKVPLAIFAGAEDRRTPPAQSALLVEQMERADKKSLVEIYHVQPGEGHGYYRTENNVTLYTKMLTFLDRHIGAKSKAGSNKRAAPKAL